MPTFKALQPKFSTAGGLCPRNPAELQERLARPGQQEVMMKRGSSEARSAIMNNVILNIPMREKSIDARERACGRAGPSHNRA